MTPLSPTSPMPALSATSSLAQAVADLGANGSPRAWARIAEQCSQRMGRLALRLTGRSDLADDVVQDALLLIRAHARSFSPRSTDADGDALAWILRVTATTAFQLLRSQRRLAVREAHAGPRDGSSAPRPEQHLEDQEQAARVRAALLGLPLRLQTVLALHAIEGFSHAAIASALRMPLGSAKTYLRRGQARLRAALGADADHLLLALLAAGPTTAPAALPAWDGRVYQKLLTSARRPRWGYGDARRFAAGYRPSTSLVSTSALVAILVAAVAVILHWAPDRHPAAPSASPRAASALAAATPSLHGAAPPAQPAALPAAVPLRPALASREAPALPAAMAGIRLVSLVIRGQPLGAVIDLLNHRYDAHIRIDPANPGRLRPIDLFCASMPLNMVCATLADDSGLAFRPDRDGFTVAMPSHGVASTADALIQTVTIIPAPDRGQPSAASDSQLGLGGSGSQSIGRCGQFTYLEMSDGTDNRLLYGVVLRCASGLSFGMGSDQSEDNVLHASLGIGGQTLEVVADDQGQRASIMGKEIDLSRGHVLLVSLAGGALTVQQIDVDFGSAPMPLQAPTAAEMMADMQRHRFGQTVISERFVAWIMGDPRAQRLIQ